MDQHTDEEFLQKAFESNVHLKKDYSLGTIKSYKDVPGWINDAEWIYKLIVDSAEDGDQFLEIGTFFGQSAARMAELIRDSDKDLKFYSMDIFYEIDTCIALDRHPKSFKEFRNAHNYTDIYNLIVNMFEFMGLREYVEFICCDSKYGHKLFVDNSLKLVYIDGSHSYESVYADLVNFWPKVKVGGYIACDDTVYDSVKDAIKDFCKLYNIKESTVSYVSNSCTIKKN
jgi:predicted O-methyltransferase YrrM